MAPGPKMRYLRLTKAQRFALVHGSSTCYVSARQNGARADVMAVLSRKGLAELREETKPSRHMTYRLTEWGGIIRAEIITESVCRRCDGEGIDASSGFRRPCPAEGCVDGLVS